LFLSHVHHPPSSPRSYSLINDPAYINTPPAVPKVCTSGALAVALGAALPLALLAIAALATL
jgi:hypothetical protein